jgi:hypothetical protein
VLATTLGYNLVDQFFETLSDWASSTPYWVLFLIAGILITLFIISLAKKLVVSSVLLAVLLVGACAVWFFSGSTVGLN